jgi:magnesium chelatase family protein
MPRLPALGLLRGSPEGSGPVAARIAAARAIQLARGGRLNARVDGRHLRAVARLDGPAERRLIELADRAELSARATTRLLRVARTIADLARERAVGIPHLEEAARYRSGERRRSIVA